MSESISREQIDQLIEDASYMQDEAEALKYVIEEVPYQKQPPNDYSIAERLLFIDRAQLSYFRPALEEAMDNTRPVNIDDFQQFKESFDASDKEVNDIQILLTKLSKHRAGVINKIRNISIVDWETLVYISDKEISLFDFIQKMVRFDRKQLKNIADLVRILGAQKQTDRKIKEKQSIHNSSTNQPD